MRSQRMLLLLVAAVVGMMTPSAASAAPPSPAPTTTQLLTGPGGWLGQHRRPRWRAVRHRIRRRQDLARRSEDRGDHDVRQRSAAVDHRHRRHDRRRVHRRDRVRTGHRCRPRRRRQRRRRHLPNRRPRQLHRRRGHRRVRLEQSAGITAFDVPTGVQYALETYRGGFLVTDGHHNRVLPGHARRRGQRADRVRQHRPDRAGDHGQHGLHGRGRTCPARSRGRQGGVVQAEVTQRHGGGLRCPTPRRRGVWPRSRSVRPLAGHLRWRPSGCSGGAEHRQPREGERNGTFSAVVDGLDRPTSVEFIQNTAYVVTLTGEIWKIENVSGPPHGVSH